MDLKPNILVLDNYDSFTHNLVHQLRELGHDKNVDVYRNDCINIDEVNRYDKILMSPGPGVPKESGIMIDMIRKYSSTKSILGVCLGHQSIAESFGGSIYNMNTVFHGVTHTVSVTKDSRLFKNMPRKFEACRYHSWIVDSEGLPDVLKVTAVDNEGRIMAMEHASLPIFGVQFHPEAFTTKNGIEIVKNWLAV